MHLRSDFDEALFSYIGSALDTAALDLQSRDEVRSLIRAVIDVTQDAIAGFAERWNARRPPRLPPEVLSGCFEWLPFNGRLAVSHVSRHWRRVALDSPALWSTFANNANVDKLREMLRRSEAMPLFVNVTFHHDAEEVALRSHGWRIRELTCLQLPRDLDLDAPRLEKLKVEGVHAYVELTGASIGRSAQSLRALELCGRDFSFAPSCPPLVNLREFKGDATISTDFHQLFRLCPALVFLSVFCADKPLGNDISSLFAPIPDSLAVVSVSGIHSHDGPNFDSVSAWQGHRFRSLELKSLGDISGIVSLFASSVNSGWRMDVSLDECVSYTLSTPTEKTVILGYSTSGPGASRLGSLVAQNMLLYQDHLRQLAALRLPLLFFAPCIRAGILLPALTELTLEDDCTPGNIPNSNPMSDDSGPGIATPALSTFAFVRHPRWSMRKEALEWFVLTLPQFLRVWVRYEADVLERITLAVDVSPGELDDAGFHQSAIHAMAKAVLVDRGDKNSS